MYDDYYTYEAQNARKVAFQVLLKNCSQFPINLKDICNTYNISLYSLEDFIKKEASTPEADKARQIIELGEMDAFCLGSGTKNNPAYTVIYNGQQSEYRYRFSCAHELGHIVLNHYKRFSKSDEAQANNFAGELLRPSPLIRFLNLHNHPDGMYIISSLFQVSKECAQVGIRQAQYLNRFCPCDKTLITKLYLHFSGFLANAKKQISQNWSTENYDYQALPTIPF